MSTADKLNKLLETKQAIKQAIIDKGVDVSDNTVFAEYPAKINAIEGASNIDLSNYVTKDELPTVPTNVSELNNDAGYLTEHQDISHLALKSEIPEVPSIEGLATKDELPPIRVIGNGVDAEEYIFTGNEFTDEEYENCIGLSVLLDNVHIAGTNFSNELGYVWLWIDGDNKVMSFENVGFYYEFVFSPDGNIISQNEDSYAWSSELENYATKEELNNALGDIESLLGNI